MNQEEKRIMKLMAKEVKRLREEKNLTQEVFAEIIGVSRDLIAKIETGKRKITSNVIIKILIAFNISQIDLYGFENSDKFSINI